MKICTLVEAKSTPVTNSRWKAEVTPPVLLEGPGSRPGTIPEQAIMSRAAPQRHIFASSRFVLALVGGVAAVFTVASNVTLSGAGAVATRPKSNKVPPSVQFQFDAISFREGSPAVVQLVLDKPAPVASSGI